MFKFMNFGVLAAVSYKFLNVFIPLFLSLIKVYDYQSTQLLIVSYAYYSDMFRLNRVIVRLS